MSLRWLNDYASPKNVSESLSLYNQVIMMIEIHPLQPFLPPNAKLLMLGSFPPPQNRWKMDFYYPNFQNDMWRIFGVIFFQDKNYFIDVDHKCFKEESIRLFLMAKGIAIFDTAEQITRLKGNASDQFLSVEKATDIPALLACIPACRYIMTTGDKATETLHSVLPEGTQKPTLSQSSSVIVQQKEIHLYRLPSSSRAYPLALEKKAQIYKKFFEEINML